MDNRGIDNKRCRCYLGGESEKKYLPWQKEVRAMKCVRCKGLMVLYYLQNVDNIYATSWLDARRCINCGEITEPGMLQNRSDMKMGKFKKRIRKQRRVLSPAA